jgi:alpha-tubulin suppressor-like RCC1 family protein
MFGDNVFKQLGVTEEDATVEADKLYIGRGMILIQRFNTQTAGGTLLGRGRNLYNMLYLSTNAIVDTFEIVDPACNYKYVSIGNNRVVALTYDNQIFAWGKAIDQDIIYNSPQSILNDPVDEWAYVVTGNSYIAALNTDGDAYLLGNVF